MEVPQDEVGSKGRVRRREKGEGRKERRREEERNEGRKERKMKKVVVMIMMTNVGRNIRQGKITHLKEAQRLEETEEW